MRRPDAIRTDQPPGLKAITAGARFAAGSSSTQMTRPARVGSGARGVLCEEQQADLRAGVRPASAVFRCADRAIIRQVGFARTTRLCISFHGTQFISSGPWSLKFLYAIRKAVHNQPLHFTPAQNYVKSPQAPCRQLERRRHLDLLPRRQRPAQRVLVTPRMLGDAEAHGLLMALAADDHYIARLGQPDRM